jgi:hypothetical protein
MELDRYELTWYMYEICMHGMGADIEYERFNSVLTNNETRQTRLVWFHLTSFLSHTAMISKYVSPVSNKNVAVARSHALSALLGVTSGSDVLPRHARDNIEHFDERIDNWVSGDNKNLIEAVLPDRDSYNFMRVSEKSVKRVLILNELVFVSEKNDGSKFELRLQPLHEEVQRITAKAQEWIVASSPYNFIYPR